MPHSFPTRGSSDLKDVMANSSVKVRPLLAYAPLSAFQIAVVALCVLINICDGLDTTAPAYAAPAILKDWRLAPQTMALTLSAGASGLILGANLIAPLADRFGRRPIVLAAATTSAENGSALVSKPVTNSHLD